MAAPRMGGIELNFDGLTDAVTNLVGSLVLFVILVIGSTRPVLQGQSQPSAPKFAPGGERKVDEIVARLQSLKASLDVIERDIVVFEDRLPKLEKETELLADQRRPSE